MELALGVGANHIVCNRMIGPEMVDFTVNASQLRSAMNTIDSLRSKGRPIRFGNCIPQCFENSNIAWVHCWQHLRYY